jgi:hypothetical protein
VRYWRTFRRAAAPQKKERNKRQRKPPNPPNQKRTYRTPKMHINTARYIAFFNAAYMCSINVQKSFIAQLLRSRFIAPKDKHR